MDQLLREWPPGFGGIERMAHNIATQDIGYVFSLKSNKGLGDSLSVSYKRRRIFSIEIGRVLLPIPSITLFKLLTSDRPLLAHLPCPTVLVLALLARLLRPKRSIQFYWHSFLAPRVGIVSKLENIYQSFALRSVRIFPVITSSPILEKELLNNGILEDNLYLLPCSLPDKSETEYQMIWERRAKLLNQVKGTLIFIGRLDSYKRVDWLIRAFYAIPAARELHVVGDGPDRTRLEALAKQFLLDNKQIHFHGRLNEINKQKLLAYVDVMVLPSDRCNEAFGIVQLEAMACGIPSLAYSLPCSGMHWVSKLPCISWSGKPEDLAVTIQKLLVDPDLYQLACYQAKRRFENEFSSAIWCDRLAQLPRGK